MTTYDKEVWFDEDDLIHKVENYMERDEGGSQVQPPEGNLPQFSLPSRALSSMGAGTSVGDAGSLTSGTAPSTSGPRYACKDWVLLIYIGKLKSIAREYRLWEIGLLHNPNERPHLPHVGYMAFSKAILKAEVSLPLHPFINEVLQFFDVVQFQLTLNSYCIIVTFYIAFAEACEFELSVGHFAYVFWIKAVAKHVGFWYMIGRGDATGIAGILSNIGEWKNDFFFYPYAHSGEFRMARKWKPASSLFAYPPPRPALEDIEVSHVRIFNAFLEEQRNYKFVVTPE